MAVFASAEDAARIIGGFFEQEARDATDHLFAGSGMILGYALSNPTLSIVLDATGAPEPGKMFAVYVNDPNAPAPKVTFELDCDTFDSLYRGETQAMTLMMTGKAKAKGDLTAGMRLLPAMGRAIPHYKKYRETH